MQLKAKTIYMKVLVLLLIFNITSVFAPHFFRVLVEFYPFVFFMVLVFTWEHYFFKAPKMIRLYRSL